MQGALGRHICHSGMSELGACVPSSTTKFDMWKPKIGGLLRHRRSSGGSGHGEEASALDKPSSKWARWPRRRLLAEGVESSALAQAGEALVLFIRLEICRDLVMLDAFTRAMTGDESSAPTNRTSAHDGPAYRRGRPLCRKWRGPRCRERHMGPGAARASGRSPGPLRCFQILAADPPSRPCFRGSPAGHVRERELRELDGRPGRHRAAFAGSHELACIRSSLH